jgi:hypothetical protein
MAISILPVCSIIAVLVVAQGTLQRLALQAMLSKQPLAFCQSNGDPAFHYQCFGHFRHQLLLHDALTSLQLVDYLLAGPEDQILQGQLAQRACSCCLTHEIRAAAAYGSFKPLPCILDVVGVRYEQGCQGQLTFDFDGRHLFPART